MKSYPIDTDLDHLPVSPQYGQAISKSSGFTRLLYKILPRHILLPLKDELSLSWLRWKTRNLYKRYRNAKALKVNVGSGLEGKSG